VDRSILGQPLRRRRSARPNISNGRIGGDARFTEEDIGLLEEVAADIFLARADIETAVVSAFELVDVCRRSIMRQSGSLEVIVRLAAKFLKSGFSVHDAVIAAVQLQYIVRSESIVRATRDGQRLYR
jgi:hypothetical protein